MRYGNKDFEKTVLTVWGGIYFIPKKVNYSNAVILHLNVRRKAATII